MLLLAGCSNHTTPVLTEKQTPSNPATPEPTATPTQKTAAESSSVIESADYGPDSGQNLTQYSNELGVASAGLNETEQQRVQRLVAGFYDDMGNESERREKMLNSAAELCQRDREFDGEARAAALEDRVGSTDDTIRRAEYAAEIANEFNPDVPVKPLDDIHSKARDYTKYAPLFGSYNQMREKACIAKEQRTDAAIQEYQIAVVMFGVDAMLVSTGAFYQPAFSGTRFTANKASQLGLYRLRYICGDRCWALGMSEVHVALRGSMLITYSAIVRQSTEMGANLSRDDLEAVADEHNTDVDTLMEDTNITVTNGTLVSVSDSIADCAKALQEEETLQETDGLLGGDGVDADDVVSAGEDIADEPKHVVKDCSGGS